MIKRLIAIITFIVMIPAVAFACPQISGSGYELDYSGGELWNARDHRVVAGGSENLERCRRSIRPQGGERVIGWVAESPDFELYFDADGYELEFRIESRCDTVLLINTGGGNWYFDDDDGRGEDAKIRLRRPSSGLYDIWIGTYDSELCDNATLVLESF